MTTIDEFAADFTDEPGYLDFARVGPPGRSVRAEESAQSALLARARFGTIGSLFDQDRRLRDAVAALTGFSADQVVAQPSTSHGIMHAMFGLTGTVALSPGEFPSLTFGAARAAAALGVLVPLWLETDHGRVTPGNLRDQLTANTIAVAVSLVDFRTGYLADLEGIRQVIGDRLLLVDAIQGFGIVDAPYGAADIVVSGGQKWARAGWGSGFMALSERAIEQLVPVFSGFNATDAEDLPLDEVIPPVRGAGAFRVSHPDHIAQARLALALENIAAVGVSAIQDHLAEKTAAVIDLADEFGIPVISARAPAERAGIVVLEPRVDQVTVMAAALHNHGVTTTVREGSVRVSPHVSSTDETLGMLRASFVSFASTVTI